MFSTFERLMAFRYLRARKAEGFVSVIAGFSFLGIMLGVATLIIVMSVMNGFRAELMGRILGLNGHINVVQAQAGPLTNFDDLGAKLEQVESVTKVFPAIEKQALISRNGSAQGVMVRGIRAADFAAKPVLSSALVQGGLADFKDDGAIIGKELARNMGLGVGDMFTLLSPQGRSTPFGTMPTSRSFVVAGVFDAGMYEYDTGYIFIPLETAQIFYGVANAVQGLEIYTTDPATSVLAANKIANAIGRDYRVVDWRDTNASFFNALQVERNVMFLILTLIIVVAAFNIISSMIMLVKDKGRDIAILRTMGASRRSMLKIFILTGAAIGFIGTFAGAVLGISFALNIEAIRQFIQSLTGTNLFSAEVYFLSKLPAKIEWYEVLAVVSMGLVLSLLATLYPAWRAAKLDPVEALRYE